MAVFDYEAIAESGKSVRGVIDADSPAAARRKLREQELFPTSVRESTEKTVVTTDVVAGSFSRIKGRDVALMTRQLAVLVEAGMSLVEALSALLDQTSNPRLKKVIFEVRDRVNEGMTLADAMSQHPRVFNLLYTNMVRAGEASGALEAVLMRLAELLERNVRLRARVVSALAYPVLMAFVSVGVIVFLMMVVVPQIVGTFARQKVELPGITKALLFTCDIVYGWWWAMLLMLAAGYFTWRGWVKRPEGRLQWDRFKIWVPYVGDLYLKVVCGRFSRTLGSMLESGLTMLNALEVVKTVLQNRQAEQIMDDVKTQVRRGRNLSEPLRDSGMFPPMLVHMVELGQRSGELPAMLLKTADTYDEEVNMAVDALVSLLEPVIILVMGLFVGFLVIAMLLPILTISSTFA
ncbi:MAG TPA: type II secretion system inner membrane protein GspF [Candidatus Hydrogenedentes bacterium]|nr:type II secretion system inner membrane protein GspF [Candidatus Hydrogenedentota bacterium]HQH51967.1 type II secretion system inner membrane protein GspF [Candidatus Hydrogenedentota bacterium]HQM50274.1 type II secretion system inner membrane protein GspF [Candidatus Hydrogenedentota bacterium]